MQSRKQLAYVIDQLISETEVDNVEDTTLDDYKKLNDKCDNIIVKIKKRKSKNKTVEG